MNTENKVSQPLTGDALRISGMLWFSDPYGFRNNKWFHEMFVDHYDSLAQEMTLLDIRGPKNVEDVYIDFLIAHKPSDAPAECDEDCRNVGYQIAMYLGVD